MAMQISVALSRNGQGRRVETCDTVMQQIWAAWDGLRRPIWMFDPVALRGVYANPAALSLWGAASLEELLARDFSGISETVRARTDRLSAVTADGTEISERWTFYPNGRPITVQATISTYDLDGGAPVLLFEASPIDAEPEERRALEALRHTSSIISLFDDVGSPLFANPAAFAAYGRLDLAFESRFADVESGRTMVARALAGEAVTLLSEVVSVGGRRWHHLDARPGLDPVTGKAIILLNEQDVTAAVEAQAARTAAEHKVAEAEARQAFLTEMSHELRTPLNAVLGFADLLARSEMRPEQSEQAERILVGGRRLLTVVNEMIRVSEGSDSVAPEPVFTEVDAPPIHDRPLRALYVDDSEPNRRLVATVLHSQGCVCETAEDGRQGLEAVRAGDWDLILMDIQMPVMDGIEAARAIRALGDYRARVPIVAVTANTLTAQLEVYRAAGMDDWIEKPVDIGLLVEKTYGWGMSGWRHIGSENSETGAAI